MQKHSMSFLKKVKCFLKIYLNIKWIFQLVSSPLTPLSLFITGVNATFFFSNYALKNSRLSKGYLSKGNGPNELISGGRAGIVDDKLWIYDVNLKKIVTVDIKNVIANNTFSPSKEYKVKDYYSNIVFADSLHFCGDGKLISPSRSKLEKINLISGKKTGNYGEYRKLSSDLKLETIADIYSSITLLKPSGGKIVMGYLYSDLIEIYNVVTGKCMAIQGPEKFDVYFEQKNNSSQYYMGKNMKTRRGFVGGTVTDKYIYMVYSGHKIEDRSKEDRFKFQHGKTVFVYDWEGNPVKKLILDRLIGGCLGVSKDDKTLYSFDENTGYIIKADIK